MEFDVQSSRQDYLDFAKAIFLATNKLHNKASRHRRILPHGIILVAYPLIIVATSLTARFSALRTVAIVVFVFYLVVLGLIFPAYFLNRKRLAAQWTKADALVSVRLNQTGVGTAGYATQSHFFLAWPDIRRFIETPTLFIFIHKNSLAVFFNKNYLPADLTQTREWIDRCLSPTATRFVADK